MTDPSSLNNNQKSKNSSIRLTGKAKTWLISAHAISGAIWLGTVLSMMVMIIHNLKTTNGDELYGINSVVKLLDDWVVIPAANMTLLSGLLLSWLTIWGFFKYYWVITKLVLTVSLITFGTFWLGPWTNAMTAISDTERAKALSDPLFMFDTQALIIGSVIQILSLLFIFIISFLKPWGRRNITAHKESDAGVV